MDYWGFMLMGKIVRKKMLLPYGGLARCKGACFSRKNVSIPRKEAGNL